MAIGNEPAVSGFSVLDGVALVAGAAVASVHLRGVMWHGPAGVGWVFVAGTFALVALTAAGPFVYVVRGRLRRWPGYPQVGDGLWALLGLPWLLTALVQSTPGGDAAQQAVVSTGLGLGLAAASAVALAVVWVTWVHVTPRQASGTFAPPWTNRMGLFLAVAWPLQCGAGMVVIG